MLLQINVLQRLISACTSIQFLQCSDWIQTVCCVEYSSPEFEHNENKDLWGLFSVFIHHAKVKTTFYGSECYDLTIIKVKTELTCDSEKDAFSSMGKLPCFCLPFFKGKQLM